MHWSIWKKITTGKTTKNELYQELLKKGISLTGFTHEVLRRQKLETAQQEKEIKLILVNPKYDLQMGSSFTTEEILERARQRNLTPCQLEVGLHLLLEYHNQPWKETFILGTERHFDDLLDEGMFYIDAENEKIMLGSVGTRPETMWLDKYNWLFTEE